ncbi:MAG TPA: hypothetical protein VFM99_03085 [Chitinophagales bacterium]|nr:hypothetical protein [Chitinophagales bacterium]
MKISKQNIFKAYYWNHAAIRKDLVRLEMIAIKVDLYNANGFQNAHQWFQHHCKAVLYYYRREKNLLLTELHKYVPDFKILMQLIEQLQEVCTTWMPIIDDSFTLLAMDKEDAVEIEKLKQALQKYANATILFLTQQELLIEEIIGNVNDAEAINLEKKFLQSMPLEGKVHSLPWVLDAMSENEKNDLINKLSFKTKLLYNIKLKSKYYKLVSNL